MSGKREGILQNSMEAYWLEVIPVYRLSAPGAKPGFYFGCGPRGLRLKNKVTFYNYGQKCTFLYMLLVYPESEQFVNDLQGKPRVNLAYLKTELISKY